MDQQKTAALASIDQISQLICDMSDSIWDVPELGFQEFHAAQVQCEALEQLGFHIEKNLANIPTAFSGSWGSGKPVIAFMGEFDALATLSQKAGVTHADPVVPDGNGHGCGHHLLGSGAIAGAYAVKEYLKSTGKQGTVIYYGCPAEESGSGKTFMARDGVFDDLDCAFYWHPGPVNWVNPNTTLANYAVKYRFKGISAHASAGPHRGRSALDAVELMNTGIQYLREHVPQEVRMHYAITDAGGISPNVVQSKAEVYYLIRAPKVATVQEVYERVNKVAQGAAMMTETEVEIRFEKACSEQLINQTMNEVLHANLSSIPLPELTEEDLAFAQAIRETTSAKIKPGESPIMRTISPLRREVKLEYASGDLGDVSQICPVGELMTATWARNTPSHAWQATAQGKCPAAHKGMLFAGKVLAAAAIDLLNEPEKLAQAQAELKESMGGNPYFCPIPKGVPIPNL